MTALSTKNFATLVSDQAAAIQGRAATLVDFTEGSILLSVIESGAFQGLWLQSLILAVLAVTRASTSTGADLDSFVGDFGLTRDPAVGATTQETFGRFTNTSSALILLGSQVQTADGTQTFQVIEDNTNPHWNGSTGYTINSGTSSITVPVQAIVGGAASNVLANTITVLLTSIPGVDYVNNSSAASGGTDAETDPALLLRFQQFIAGLGSATVSAIKAAIAGVQPGLTYTVNPNVNPDGSPNLGYVTIIVDDGSGNPPAPLLTAVTNAVDAVIGAAITFGVFGPTLVTANYAVGVLLAPGYTSGVVYPLITAAVTAFMASLAVGESLIFNRMYQVVYDASPGITDIVTLTVNSGTSNIVATGTQVIRAGTGTIT